MSFLERYLDTVETLPAELHKNLGALKELDEKAEEHSALLEVRCKKFLEAMQQLSPAKRHEEIQAIQEDFKRTRLLSERKVALSVETYETVDKYIQELDTELDHFEAEHGDKGRKRGRGEAEAAGGRRKVSVSEEAERIEDMPVDPNEPTYCLCQQVSYGEMIACDNADCSTEWFHFACVNLKEKPTRKWYCPMCTSLAQAS
mmetsp:Transcript_12617/g.32252  ORF Transcript_12617/g.32252 Transcript_12617/m.32252 type:complete len:202 (+) Transcript_12617:33-638(+)